MYRRQKQDQRHDFFIYNKRYPFSLQELLPTNRQVLLDNVINTFQYYGTTICVSIGEAPIPVASNFDCTTRADGLEGCNKDPKGHTDYLIISFRDHQEFEPGYRMPQITQFQLLHCFGMLRNGESPDNLLSFVNRSLYNSAFTNTTYYFRPISECWMTEKNLRKAFVDGVMDMEGLWEFAYSAG